MGKRVNTTKKERLALLKELGYTEDDMQRFWNECIEVNHKIRLMHNCGKNWTDLTVHQMRQLPTLKEVSLKQSEESRKEEEAELEAKKQAQAEKDYYEEHFEEVMLQKIENKEELTETELHRLVHECDVVDETRGENRRWSRTITSVVKLGSKFFAVEWEEGLTENQDNSYSNQPYEVELHEHEKTIVVKEWNKVGDSFKGV